MNDSSTLNDINFRNRSNYVKIVTTSEVRKEVVLVRKLGNKKHQNRSKTSQKIQKQDGNETQIFIRKTISLKI